MQTLLWCPYSPSVQSHASTSVPMLKNPNTDTVTVISLFGHMEILHALIEMGNAALAAVVP